MSESENQSFPTFAALRARHSELLELDAETDGDEKYLADVQSFFDRARATGAILSAGEERRATQSILNYWATVLYRADHKPSNTTLVELDPTFKPKLDDTRCPYPGVREFHESENKYFFGRQRTIDYLLARLKEERFLALVGPSGGGKSSFVRAGLLPAIKKIGLEEDQEDLQRHFFPIITPGRDPLSNLASLLSAVDKSPEPLPTEHYREKLQQNSEFLADFLAEITTVAVIVVDQFEELFTLCKDRDTRRMFINNLVSLAGTKHRVILCTNMEDFGNAFKRLPEFEKAFERGRTLLPRLGVAELTDAVTKPADLVGFKFKDKTVKAIVQEIGTLPVSLPLLQFTLVKLWEKRGQHDEYFSKSGGCRALLTQSAEEFLQSLESQDRHMAETIFRRMVKFEYKYQARVMPVQLGAHAVAVRLHDLRNDVGPAEQVDAMVERMSNAHLIRRSPSAVPEDSQIELVHESLIQNWLTMAQWVESQKDKRFRTASLSVAALIILAVVGVVFLGAKTIDAIQKYKAHDQASRWARASRKNLTDRRVDTAMLLSLAGYLTDPVGESEFVDRYLFRGDNDLPARGALLSAFLFQPAPVNFLNQRGVGDIAFSPTEPLLAANDSQGNIFLWDLNKGHRDSDLPDMQDPLAQGAEIAPLLFSNDGKHLVSGGAEARGDQVMGVVSLWEVTSRKQIKKLVASDIGRVVAVGLSRDGKTMAALGRNGGVAVWDVNSGTTLPPPTTPSDSFESIAISHSGEVLAMGDAEGNVVLWDVKRRRKLRTLTTCECLKERAESSNSIASIAFSPDDQKVAVSGTEETMLWPVSGQGEPTRLAASRAGVGMILAFSQGGETLAGFEGTDLVYMWDLTDVPKRIGENLFQPIATAASLAFNRDVKTLATRSEQGIILWNLAGQQTLTGQLDDINSLAFSPDNKILAAADEDGFIFLRDGTTGVPLGPPLYDPQQSSVTNVAFSHRGEWLASGFHRGGIILWSTQGEKTSSVGVDVLDQEAQNKPPLAIWSLTFSNDDTKLITVGRRDTDELQLDVWTVPEMGHAHGPIKVEGGLPTAVAFSADGSMLALALRNQKVQFWDITDQPRIAKESPNLGTVIEAMEFSPDGRWLVFGGDNTDSVFRYGLTYQESVPIFLEGLSGNVSDLSFSSDGRMLAVVVTSNREAGSMRLNQPGAVVLVDINEPRVITESIRGHDSGITALAFRPDGKFMSTGGQDGTVLLWSLDVCEAQKRICSAVKRQFSPEEINEHWIPEEYVNACRIDPVESKKCPATPSRTKTRISRR